MAKKANIQEQAPEQVIDHALVETESFLQKHWGKLTIILAVILIAVGGWFYYQKVYLPGQSEEAAKAMYSAQQLFAEEQWEAALAEMQTVAEEYDNVPEGNLALYYCGACYFNMGNYAEAKTYLQKYEPTEGTVNQFVNAEYYSLLGDICVEEQDYQGAIDNYKKAVAATDNITSTPKHLKKLGLAYEATENYTEAVATYKVLQSKYAGSYEASDIAKYIGAAEQNIQ